MTHNVIKYTSDNGYTGTLYGKSSMSICDKDGVEIFHTGFRKANTYDELVEIIEEFPKLLAILKRIPDDEDIDEDDDI